MTRARIQLTSRKNPVVQALRKALRNGRATDEGFIAIEGPHLLQETLRSGWQVVRVFTGQQLDAVTTNVDTEIVELPADIFSSISDTATSQGVIALVRPREYKWPDLLGSSPFVLGLDGIQDPGNAGTLLRSAEAFGATGVVLLSGTVRVTNGKFLRASAGSIFRIPFLENIARRDFVEKLRSASIPMFALAPNGKHELCKVDLTRGLALVVGSEGAGVSPELLVACETLRIPVTGVESLNAAIAGSIALFEAKRQRFGA